MDKQVGEKNGHVTSFKAAEADLDLARGELENARADLKKIQAEAEESTAPESGKIKELTDLVQVLKTEVALEFNKASWT